jgi:uncharacterized protein (DUF1015 family)
VDASEVRVLIEKNPISFLRVTRSEGDFPEGAAPTNEEVFERSRENLERFVREGIYQEDDHEAIYVYQLAMEDRSQTGVVACCSIDEYDEGKIKKHENVRPDKVEDRTEHLLAVGAQTGLIFLTFRSTDDVKDLIEAAVKKTPLYSFECAGGVRQRIWRITETKHWRKAFAKVQGLYIADGHHRIESAKLARNKLREQNPDHDGTEDYNFVVAGMFPAEELKILPYNRVVKDLNGLDRETLFTLLRKSFIVVETIEKEPLRHGEISMYFEGEWFKLRFNAELERDLGPVERLDVSILQDHVLGPILGIDDPRTNDRIHFVGGAHGTDELERLVDEHECKVAFSLFPTTMVDMLTISDVGETMPPKSTWFEPKLKDGLLIHKIN